jgi:sugar lactone lactonase YvrE
LPGITSARGYTGKFHSCQPIPAISLTYPFRAHSRDFFQCAKFKKMTKKNIASGWGKTSLFLASGLALFSSCQRQGIVPNAGKETAQSATTPRTGLAPSFTGLPHDLPVRMAVVSTLTGRPGAATFHDPSAVSTDINGNIYVADQDNNMIKKFGFDGSLIASWGSTQAGYRDGTPANAAFNAPSGVAVGPDGRVFVADYNNNRIRVISADGSQVSTYAGSGRATFNDGQGTLASFNRPSGVAIDGSGQLFIADYGNNMVRRISPTGGVTRWVGQTAHGAADGNGSLASFNGPKSITVAPDGTAYVADINNQKIRKIRSANVTTLAGSGIAGPNDGVGAGAEFNFPSAVTADANGDLYVTDSLGNAIRFVTKTGTVRTVAGGQRAGFNDSYDINAQFFSPTGITIDFAGNMYVADRSNQAIRKVLFLNAVKTLAGNGKTGYQEGGGFGAIIETPQSTATGPDGSVYIMDAGSRIRKITPDGTTSLVAGTGKPGFQDGPAAQAQFSSFTSMVVGRDGTIYVADQLNRRIRKIAGGIVSTFAGSGEDAIRAGVGTDAAIGDPAAICIDGNNLDIVTTAGLVMSVSIDRASMNIVSAINIAPPFNGPGFQPVNGIAVDGAGNTYVSTKVHTIYGFARNQFSHIVLGGYDANRNFTLPDFDPTNIAYDPFTGRIFISEGTSFRISSMAAGLTQTFRPGTIAGTGVGGDIDAPVFTAQFFAGSGGRGGIAVSPTGIIYFSDASNNKVKALSRP